MIFRQVDEIKTGKKTQTRRVFLPQETAYPSVVNIMWVSQRTAKGWRMKWEIDKRYAACPKRGMKRFGNICIKGIRLERLQRITSADARAEGVSSVEEYKALWESINGKSKGCMWEDDPLVWVIEFVYLGDV